MDDLVLRRYNKGEMCLNTITLEVVGKRTQYQLVHHLSLVNFQVKLDFIIPIRVQCKSLGFHTRPGLVIPTEIQVHVTRFGRRILTLGTSQMKEELRRRKLRRKGRLGDLNG